MRWLYNILFSVLFGLASPWLWLKLRRRGPWREAFGQRFGRYREGVVRSAPKGTRRLWLHAVSVGEANTCLQFLTSLQNRSAGIDLVVSTTTNTGMAELSRKLPKGVTPVYFPIDSRGSVRRALEAVRPDAVVLVEREIWPNFLWELRDRSIPLFLINARISPRSHRAYKRYAFLFRQLYAQFERVAAQTEPDAEKLIDVGCNPERIRVCGNMKFDSATTQPASTLDVPALLTLAGRKPGAPVLVAGSTHDGEELLIARLGNRLRDACPDLLVVIVPRHFERCGEVSDRLRNEGIDHVLRSKLNPSADGTSHSKQTLLVDSTGELTAFYAEADVVFIGKSISARGGQNPIEPAILGKPIVVGPNMQNFAGVTQQLLKGDGAIQVEDKLGLEAVLAQLLQDPDRCHQLGRNAREVVVQNQGATERTADLILEALTSRTQEQVRDRKT